MNRYSCKEIVLTFFFFERIGIDPTRKSEHSLLHQSRIWGPFVSRNEPRNSVNSHAYDRKNVVRASVDTRTIDNENRSRIVTRSDRSAVRQVDCNGVARSDDLLRDRIRKKLNTSVLPPAIHSYVQKTEVYYSALETTYRLSTISGRR